jgi:hypothetical protein
MISLPDRATAVAALTLSLDHHLRVLLATRIAKFATPYGGLSNLTHILVVEPDDAEEDIIQAVGFSPLVNPLDGARHGSPDFQPW